MNQEPKHTALPEVPGQIEQNPEEAALRLGAEAEEAALRQDAGTAARTGAAAAAAAEEPLSLADSVRVLSPGQMVAKRFFRSKLSMVGLVTLLVLFVFSFVGPLFGFLPFIWGETEMDTSPGKIVVTEKPISYTDPVTGEIYTAYSVSEQQMSVNIKGDPSSTHLLGTDDMTYDVFSRLMYGGRVSLTIGFVVVILETLLGVILGGLAGYFGKWVDQLVMRVVDIFYCIPTLPLMLIISFMLDSIGIEDRAKLFVMMALLTLLGWAGTARLVRGQIL